MPFASQAQAHWAFATGQPFAKRWARETGPYTKLPKRVKRKAACMDCVLASLKGQQIAPGITRIRGNLCNVHGRYGPCDSALSGGKKRAAKPKGGKRAARQPAKRAAGRGTAQNADRVKRQAQRDAEHQQDREYQLRRHAQIEQDRQDRLARQTQHETERQQDRAARAQRQAEADKKRAEAAKKPASGGGKKKKLEPRAPAPRAVSPEQFARQAQRDREHAEDRAYTLRRRQQIEQDREDRLRRQAARDAEHAEDRAKRTATTPTPTPVRQRRTPIITPARAHGHFQRVNRGVRAKAANFAFWDGTAWVPDTKAETYGGVKRSKLDDSVFAGPDRSFPIKTAQDVKDAVRSLGRTKHDKAAVKRGIIRRARAIGAMDALPESWRTEKSFAVFKDATGAHRWISRTTTAFEDRDDEVISTKALETSAQSDEARGPLRWWHMGRPDPLDAERPWGPGVDLGWCDFAAISGRTLIESGTFKTEVIARAVAAHADDLELSPGFFHAAGEPDASGVFSHIRIFERSLVPKWAGRASNRYTGLVVEKTMDQKKIQALKDLGASDDVINALLADVQATEKAAEADGVRYKDARPVVDFFSRLLRGEQVTTKEEQTEAAAEVAPEPEPIDPVAVLKEELAALRAEVATLKADGFPPAEEEKQGEPFAEEPPAEEPMMEEADGGLTLSSEDLSAIGQVIAATLEPLIGALGITQKLEGHLGELKTMMSGYVKTKDDAQAALVARLDQAEAKVADLAGEAPRQQGYRASTAPDNTVGALLAATVKDDTATDFPFADLLAKLVPGQLNQ